MYIVDQLRNNIGPNLVVNKSNIIVTENMQVAHSKADFSLSGNDTFSMGDFNLPALPSSFMNLSKPIVQEVFK